MIILVKNLDKPFKFVICWTKNGKDIGGTGLTLRIAIENKIPIFNLYDENTFKKIEKYIKR